MHKLCVLVGVLGACRNPDGPPDRTGSVNHVAATPDGGAVLTWIGRVDPRSGPPMGWVTRLDRSGKQLWKRDIPASIATATPIVTEKLAIVRYGHTKPDRYSHLDTAYIAWDLTTGEQKWDQIAAQGTTTMTGVMRDHIWGWTSSVAGGELLAAVDGVDDDLIVDLDLATGKPKWKTPIKVDKNWSAPIAFPSGFAMPYYDALALGALPTGITTIETAVGSPCVVGDEIISVHRDNDALSLVAYRYNTPMRTIANPFQPLAGYGSPAAEALVLACGRYGGNLVMLVQHSEDNRHHTEVMFVDPAGNLVKRIDRGLLTISYNGDHGERGMLGGDLPRFAPVVERAGETRSITMLDLETASVAWSKPVTTDDVWGIVRDGTKWVISDGAQLPAISVYDGTTGKLVGSTKIEADEGLGLGARLDPSRVAGGVAWFFGDYGQDLTTKEPVVSIDLATGKPIVAKQLRAKALGQ